MRGASVVMAGVFALAVVVQWNDPDPLLWIVLYGAAALLSVCAAVGRSFPRVTLTLFVLYTAGALYALPAMLGSNLSAYTSFAMRSPQDEVAREGLGLLLCAAWSFALWRSASRRTAAGR